ncbi:MAG: rod shape-determining protein MreC, partial [Planctomycetota bacterium]
MRRLPRPSPALALLGLSLALCLLPGEILSTVRMRLYSEAARLLTGVDALAGEDAVPSLEHTRASDDPARALADARRQAEELRNRLDRCMADLEDARRRLRQLSEAREFVPALKTLAFTPATVIARTGRWPEDPGGSSLIFDRGLDANVAAGDALLQGQAVLGQVVQVREHACRALLLNHPSLIIAGREAATRTECYVRGRLDGGVEVVFIGRAPEATPGGLVLTSGLLELFPPGLIVGEIAGPLVESRDQRTHVAPLRPRAELQAVEMALIVHRADAAAWASPA